MLRILRQKMRGILIVTVVLVSIAFIGFYGAVRSRRDMPQTVVVARVNGKKIDYQQFHNAYQRLKGRQRSIYGNEQMERQLRKDALEELIREILLWQEAKNRRIKVTDQEVLDEISSIPGLQKEGKFDKEIYLKVLRYQGVSPEKFEEEVRDELRVKKLISQVTEGVEISEEDLRGEYIKRNEKVRVKYILFKKEDFKKDIKVEENELNHYFQENREEFSVPEKVNVQYVLIDPKERESQVEINEDAVANYYQENISKFKHPEEEGKEAYTDSLEEVRSEIQTTLRSKRADEMAKEEAGDLASELVDKSEWEKMVREKKLEVKETGFFSIREPIKGIGWAPQFSQEAFALEEDMVSGAVKTPKGYAIFVLKSREKSHLPELDEVRENVEEKVKDKKASELAKSRAEECSTRFPERADVETVVPDQPSDSVVGLKEPTLEEVAQEFSMEVKDSSLFSRGEYIQGIGPSEDFSEAAFSLKEAEVSGPIETRLGFCLFQLEEHKGIDEEKYNDEKEKFRESLLFWKKIESYNKWYRSLRSEARVWRNPEIIN